MTNFTSITACDNQKVITEVKITSFPKTKCQKTVSCNRNWGGNKRFQSKWKLSYNMGVIYSKEGLHTAINMAFITHQFLSETYCNSFQ